MLEGKTRDELMAIAKEKGLKPHHKTGEAKLIRLIEELDKEPDGTVEPIDVAEMKTEEVVGVSAIEKRLRMEEEVRDKLRLEAQIRDGIAEVTAKAELRHIELDIPDKPTLKDVVRLKEQLGLEIKKPKPSPETIAIETSKKMYYTFRNQEEKGVDVKFCPGGKYHFHLFHGKLHVLPDSMPFHFRKYCQTPIFERRPNPNGNGEVSVHTSDEPRFILEPISDAPEDAKYGVVLNPEILDKFGMGPKEAPK